MSFLSDTKTADIAGMIAPESARALVEVFKYELLTKIQARVIPFALKGDDVFGKAKTGHGKTIGFLIPMIEKLVAKKRTMRNGNGSNILALIISPTRELAFQIHNEGKTMLTFHKNLNIACVVGGTSKKKDMGLITGGGRRRGGYCDILVATPGRLLDHIETTSGFKASLSALEVLTLDEADTLLDMGFLRDMRKIVASLPSSRQTFLFSATSPPDLRKLCKEWLKPGFAVVSTVVESGPSTNVQVEQAVMSVTLNQHLLILLREIYMAMEQDKEHYKIIVFCTAAHVVGLYSEIFRRMKLPIIEIHSRMTQKARIRASDSFRVSYQKILFTSDVSARGVDYPDVSMVIQLGMTDKATYIHRLGRTGRIGKAGKGLLILHDFETQTVLKELKDLPLKRLSSSRSNGTNSDEKRTIQVATTAAENSLASAMRSVKRDYAGAVGKKVGKAYQAWMGYYNSHRRKLRWDGQKLVDMANQWAAVVGAPNTPAIKKKVLGKMNLKGPRGYPRGLVFDTSY